jgi:hypothetical protein
MTDMRRLLVAAVIAACCLPIGGAAARRQSIEKGNVRVSFGGRLAPHALPRERMAPVTVHLDGSVTTVDGSRPPQLQEVSVEINRAGRLSVAGLPSCPASALQQTSTETALDLCRKALVGHGRFGVNVDFPGTPLIPARGRVLVFNSSDRRGPGMVLHLHGTAPVRATFVLPFEISRQSRGEFGTVFSAKIPTLATGLGYVTDIELEIGRRYRYAGKRHSFLSASCAAPAGFPGAVYRLARATFVFPEDEILTSTLSEDCRVR